MTFAEALGEGFLALQIILIIVGAIGLSVFCYRIWRLHEFCRIKGISFRGHGMLPHFCLNVSFNLFLILGSVDLFGFRGVVPIDAYVVFDEITAASAISNVVMTANFYYKMAHGLYKKNSARARHLTYATVGLVWLNFIGFIILGITDHSKYKLYEGLKTLGGGIILSAFGVMSTVYVMDIIKILRENVSISADQTQTKKQISTLQKKQSRFVFVIGLGVLVLLANGIMSISTPDWNWTIAFKDLPDPAQIAIRVVFILNTCTCLYMFKVPSLNDSSSNAGKQPGSSNKQNTQQIAPSGHGGETRTSTRQTGTVDMQVGHSKEPETA